MTLPGGMSTREKMIRATQAEFRRTLVGESANAARRLQAAYTRELKEINRALANAKADQAQAVLNRIADQLQEKLTGLTRAIQSEADTLANNAVKTGLQTGNAMMAATVDATFGAPSTQQIEALIGIVDSPAFKAKLSNYGAYYAGRTGDIMLSGTADGRDPIAVARQVRKFINTMPMADAVRMVSTAQLYSARGGAMATYKANADVIGSWTWSCSRDTRTCPACWAQHGKVFPLTATLNDHYLGRCAPLPNTVSWASLGFADGQDVAIKPGEELFKQLPVADQRTILGDVGYRAWRDGAYQFDQLAGTYQDDLYGEMLELRPLKELIGIDAVRAYQKSA